MGKLNILPVTATGEQMEWEHNLAKKETKEKPEKEGYKYTLTVDRRDI